MLRNASFLLLTSLLSVSSIADETEDYNRLVDRLVALSGRMAAELAAPGVQNYSRSLAETLAQNKPSLPPRAVDVISDEIALYINEQLFINPEIKRLKYSAYKNYFTMKELEELVGFYESPLGKKVFVDLPLIMQEIQAGTAPVVRSIEANLIKNIAPRLNKRMRENGW